MTHGLQNDSIILASLLCRVIAARLYWLGDPSGDIPGIGENIYEPGVFS